MSTRAQKEKELAEINARLANMESEFANKKANSPTIDEKSDKITRQDKERELAEIDAKLAQMDAKRESSIKAPSAKEVLRQVGRTGRSAALGLASIADLPNLAAIPLHGMGLINKPYFHEPIYQTAKEKIDTLTGGRLKPRNKLEEYIDEGVEALSTMGRSAISKAAQKGGTETAKLLGRNVGAATGAKTYSENVENPGMIGTMAASMLGGKTGAKLPGAIRATPHALAHPVQTLGHLGKSASEGLKNTAAKGLSKISGFNLPEYEKQTKLGLPVSMADVSKNKTPNYIQDLLAKAPFSANVMEDYYHQKRHALAKNMGMNNLNEDRILTKNPAHHLAREGAKGYAKRVGNIYEKKMESFAPTEKKATERGHPVPIRELKEELSQGKKGLITDAELKDFEKTPAGHFLGKIESYELPSHGAFTSTELQYMKKHNFPKDLMKSVREENISYGGLDMLRKEALHKRDALKPGTNEYREMDQIYNHLRDLKTDTISKLGTPSQQRKAAEAKKLYAEYAGKSKPGSTAQNMKHYVYDLIGTDIEKDAFNKLYRNEKYMKAAMNGLPKNKRKELIETIISDLGNEDNYFNSNKAHSRFSKLPHEVKDVLYKNMLPDQRKKFRGTMEHVGTHKRKIKEIANTSGTAHTQNMYKNWTAAGTALAGLASGHVAPAAALASLYGSSYGASKAMTNQKLLKRMADIQRNKLKQPKLTGKQKLNNLLVNDLLTLPNARALSYNERHKGE